MDKKYNFFICDWKDFGHTEKRIIDDALNDGECVIIAIREFEINHTNTITPLEVMSKVMDAFNSQIKKDVLKVMVIPDISSVSYLQNNNPLLLQKL